MDDVINVAGYRLGVCEIEKSISSHSNMSEVAVVGIEDKQAEYMKTVDSI